MTAEIPFLRPRTSDSFVPIYEYLDERGCFKRPISPYASGGEDLFELLDERVPTPLIVPPAPLVADTPAVVDTPIVESGEPSGYTAPVFFPFGKPEPTAPQLKLSGVSSFKKINRCERSIRSMVLALVWLSRCRSRV